ncbi:hypothetical protein BDN72DRAFT_962693 [Pluteus cervinus]|uniref:Uncharacterized protein n=1 Tax=Pluteus cervinus TaxID=181527 RepID=A0ACD3AHF1_9AGAR|nr:hypothetical protein BDN72DRAFT_962693 [Pluteus cervinus]
MPPSTRRKSIVPVPAAVDQAEIHEESDEEMASWEDEEAATTDDDEDDDWGSKKRRAPKKRDGPPPAKRARTVTGDVSASATPARKARRTRQGKLSSIMDLPLDVLFEILGLVEPQDLLSLTLANKTLRSNLMTRGAISVWKSVFERVGAPPCPPDVSHPAWAFLLFGGSRCHKCNTSNVHYVDYALRRRLCRECRKKNLVAVRRFAHYFPDYDKGILDLLPYTNVGGWVTHSTSSSRYYWKDDVYAIVKELGPYQKGIQLRTPNAKQKLDDFKAARLAYVKQIVDSVPTYCDWERKASQQKFEDSSNGREQRKNEITRRLLALGHDQRDVNHLWFRSESDKPLTDRGWAMIRAGLEKDVDERKATRLEREKADRVYARQKIFREAFRDFKRSLCPSEWSALPLFERLCNATIFFTMLQDDTEPPVGKPDFLKALDHISELTPAIMQETKTTLKSNVKTLPFEIIAGATMLSASQAASMTEEAGVDPLDLAVTVLSCGNHYPQTPQWGFDAIWQHKCSRPSYLAPNALYLNKAPFIMRMNEDSIWAAGARVAVALIKLDMDDLDARFIYDTLPAQARSGNDKVYPVYSWRKAVMTLGNNHFGRGSWRVLNREETLACKIKENQEPFNDISCWTCAHCAEYVNGFAARSVVEHHIKTQHGLPEPVEPTDLFISPEVLLPFPDFGTLTVCGPPPPPPVVKQAVVTAPNKTFYCKMCPNPKGRLFVENGVKSHLKDRHKLPVSVEGVHWARI